jgi:hypothetical protein
VGEVLESAVDYGLEILDRANRISDAVDHVREVYEHEAGPSSRLYKVYPRTTAEFTWLIGPIRYRGLRGALGGTYHRPETPKHGGMSCAATSKAAITNTGIGVGRLIARQFLQHLPRGRRPAPFGLRLLIAAPLGL